MCVFFRYCFSCFFCCCCWKPEYSQWNILMKRKEKKIPVNIHLDEMKWNENTFVIHLFIIYCFRIFFVVNFKFFLFISVFFGSIENRQRRSIINDDGQNDDNHVIDGGQLPQLRRLQSTSESSSSSTASLMKTSIAINRCSPKTFETCLSMMQEVMENSSLAFPINSRDLDITCRYVQSINQSINRSMIYSIFFCLFFVFNLIKRKNKQTNKQEIKIRRLLCRKIYTFLCR